MNFYDFYDKLNGGLYRRTPPPVKYDLEDYRDLITNKPESVVTTDGRGAAHVEDWETIGDEEMGTTPEDAVIDFMNQRGNTTKLGKPLDDEGMKRFTGMNW